MSIATRRRIPEVRAIFITPTPAGAMKSIQHVEAVAGKGLAGDRYGESVGTFSDRVGPARQVTFIEEESIEAIARDQKIVIDPSESRRNILTRGAALNHLVGREFRVGAVRLRGVKLCEPCAHLERLTGREGLTAALTHRGGLNAEVLMGGTICIGDEIVIE